MTFTERAFMRGLPGGGYVAIDVTSSKPFFGPAHCHGAVLLERRSHPRDGEHPLVVAEADGASVTSVMDQLVPTVCSNAVLAASVLKTTREVSDEPSQDNASSHGKG